MPSTYKTRHGVDWDADWSDVFIDLTVAKKHREYEADYGVVFKDPWEAILDAARALVSRDYFTISPWTEEHFHDYVMYREAITWGCASSSKAQPLGATIYTPSGIRTMGELEVGDRVISARGGVTEVVKTHDVGTQDEYKVCFSDGTSCLCAGSHLWEVAARRRGYPPKVVDAEWLYTHAEPNRYSIAACSPVEFSPQDVDIDPYLMGALLGDGGFGGASGTGVLRFSTADADILAALRSRVIPGYSLNNIPTPKGQDFCLVRDGSRGRMPNQYIRALKRYGLWAKLSPDKFIPPSYMYNTVEVRRDILSGLLDTDGTVCRLGSVSFSSSSIRLADDVAWLARSLGAIVTRSARRGSYKKPDGTTVECLMSYSVRIRLSDPSWLFKCQRKKDRVRQNVRGVTRRYINNVVRTGRSVPMKCITIADPRGLYLTNDFIVTHNSNDYGLLSVLDWLTDPYATVTIIGSTTKVDLRLRIWEAVVRYHEAIRNNDKGFVVPGLASEVGFMISNEKTDGSPESTGKKAAILGRALNEDGRLIGAHLPYVRVIVDELAAISNYASVDQGLANLSIGAKDFRFYGLANPKSWDDQSCKYCMPADGRKVDVDTGSWTSTRGIFVRHHDGLKSPAYLNPELARDYPYLMNRKQVEDNLRRVDGNEDAALFWEQTRGFPLSVGTAIPTVLDPLVASANGCGGPPPAPYSGGRTPVGLAAGVDPAWSEGGDDAVFQGVAVFEQDGKVILDFSGRTRKIPVSAVSAVPVTQQQRDFVMNEIRAAGGPDMRRLAVDSSGNQGLADCLTMQVGPGLLAVNNSNTASDRQLKKHDPTPAKELVRDRGTESWVVLAEFCRAGQVYGLPAGALSALVQRRFTLRPKSSDPVTPLKLEPKEIFNKRFKGSPNEADACALAALAVKERMNILPYGSSPEANPEGTMPEAYANRGSLGPPPSVPDADYSANSCDGVYYD